MTAGPIPEQSAVTPPLAPKKRRVWTWLLLAAALMGIGATAGVILLHAWERFAQRGTSPEIEASPAIISAVRDLSRLEGAEFQIERVISLKDKQNRLFGLVQPEDAILLVASGTVVAGVDLSSLVEGDFELDPVRRSATIVLPSSTIFAARLDNQRTYVFRRETDLLADRTESLETRARQEAERMLAAAAEEGKIVDRSNASVRRTVETLVRSLGYRVVTVNFRGEGEKK
ncbi:MAG TPA: DUF4230 domain-containing protein [Polyangiaceae bacterium]|jgi:hypothetical protein|nr:DUF4230 domain-containing protein [Polyangiaceae bacterium]